MEYLEDNYIKDFVKDIIIDKLEEYEGVTCYACDLSNTLFEGYFADGVYFYNNKRAIDFITDNFFDFGEIVTELRYQLGSENVPNVFDNPDLFCVVCFHEVASYILGRCEYINLEWNNEIILTKDVIEIIKKEVMEV